MQASGVLTSALLLVAAPHFLGVVAGAQTGGTEKKMSAREIFYSAAPAASASKPAGGAAQTGIIYSAPQAAKPAQPPKQVATSKPKPRQQTATPKPPTEAATPASIPPGAEVAATKTATPQPEVAATKPPPPPAREPGASPAQPPSEEAVFVPASDREEPPLAPLGVRYSVLKRVGPADLVEVDPGVTFRAGDQIRLRVEVNAPSHLYIIHRGSSGVWKPLFPSPQVSNGNNYIEPGRPYDIPHGYVFSFDEQAGEEKLFLVVSRQPQQDLENMIYRLSRPGQAPAPGSKPAAPAKTLLAQNVVSIDDGMVDRLRNVYARDLIIEKVDDETPGDIKENAVYAVAPSADRESQVVVDISLHHR